MILRIILLRLLESYYRHRWLYLLPIVLLTGTAAYFVLNDTPEYHARGVLYVQTDSLLTSLTGTGGSGGDWWVTPAQATQSELNELLQTDAFVRAVIRQTPLEQEMDGGPAAVQELIENVRQGVWVHPLGDNQLAVNTYHTEPQVTFELVNALIDTYLTWQVNAERSESEVAQQFFGNVIQQYQAEIEVARAAMITYLQTHPAPVRGERSEMEQIEMARLQADIDLAAGRLTSAIDNEEESRLALAQIESNVRQSHFLIDAPALPEAPTTSLREMATDIAIFVAVGIVLSAGAIVGGALLDRSFRFSVDVENRLHLPVLAVVPDISEKEGRLARWFRRKSEPHGSSSELLSSEVSDEEPLVVHEDTEPDQAGIHVLNGGGRKLEEGGSQATEIEAEADLIR